MIGKLYSVVLDCPDPPTLGRFYAEVLGWPVTRQDGLWVTIGDDTTGRLAFQHAADHVPPRWPDPAHPQQFHLDIDVDDIEPAQRRVLELGARLLAAPEGENFRVYADPAGHPFCLVWPGD